MVREPDAVEIRTATEVDLDSIAQVLVDTWRTTFRGLLSAEFLDGMSYAYQRDRHRRTMRRERVVYFVATDVRSKQVIGFANGGPNREPEYQYPGELYALYVLQAYQGRGIGSRLFRSLGNELLQLSLSPMLIWVLVNNPNRDFYRRAGGREIVTRPATLGSMTVDEVGFVCDVS
jgi:GNAT superfamily N-acetyltransferase